MRVRASLSRSRWYGWSDRAQDQCHCISDTVLRVFASLLRLSGLGQNFRHIFEVRTEELSTHESREGYTYLFSRTSLESLDCKHLLKGRMTNGLNDWLIDKYLKSKCDLLRWYKATSWCVNALGCHSLTVSLILSHWMQEKVQLSEDYTIIPCTILLILVHY